MMVNTKSLVASILQEREFEHNYGLLVAFSFDTKRCKATALFLDRNESK